LEERDGLTAGLEHEEEADEVTLARLEEIEGEIVALDGQRHSFEPQERARAGVFVTLAHDGRAMIEAGFVRPEDEPVSDHQGGEERTDDGVAANGGVSALSEKLVGNLTSHYTVALIDRLGQNPKLALAALAYSLALTVFDGFGGVSCLRLSPHLPNLSLYGEGIVDSAARRAVEARQAEWQAMLTQAGDDLWATIRQWTKVVSWTSSPIASVCRSMPSPLWRPGCRPMPRLWRGSWDSTWPTIGSLRSGRISAGSPRRASWTR
jgi:ParB family chromosome partitioning protein